MRGIAILVGTAALLTGVTVALAQAGSTSGSANNKRIIKAKIVAKSFVRSDVDTAPKGPSEGDYYVFHDRLEDMHGARAGLTDGHCTAVAIENKTTRYQCLVIETLPHGTIIHDGIFIVNTVSRFSIIGGTGEYSGAGGEAIFAPPSIEFHLSD